MARIRKTDPCPCGSGRKYKYCCGDPDAVEEASPRRGGIFLLVTAALGPLAVAFGLAQGEPEAAAPQVWSEEHGHWHDVDVPEPQVAAEAATGEAAVPAPDGPPPPGKVWSAEHGHWHAAAATEVEGQPWDADEVVSEQFRRPEFRIQRPSGPAPEGKVWDEVHGHWH